MEFEKIRQKLTTSQSSMLLLEEENHATMISHGDEPMTVQMDIIETHENRLATSQKTNKRVLGNTTSFEQTGISYSAAMTQICLLPDDVGIDSSCLPPGLSDINGQQLDLRTTNSWILKMSEVSTPEIMECFFINALAPFVLNSRLKPLMTTPDTESRPDRYIVNVSAMEGKFYRYKTPNHPHTNMAKAALNMLTRTSSEDLARY
jgi:NAD(P)-dependent dehydrogenase (short-subunit alcohol dehydrogenase family)